MNDLLFENRCYLKYGFMLYKIFYFGLGIYFLKKNLFDIFFVIDKNSLYFEKECIFFLFLNGLEIVIFSKL